MKFPARTHRGHRVVEISNRLAFADLPPLLSAFAEGVREGALFWALDLSAVEEMTSAVVAPLVAMAGGLRSFGGDVVLVGLRGEALRAAEEMGLTSQFKILPTPDALTPPEEHAPSRREGPDRAAMEEALFVFQSRRPTKRILRRDVPMRPNAEVALLDEARKVHPGRIVEAPHPGELRPDLVVSAPELWSWEGTLEVGTVIAFRIFDVPYVYEAHGAAVHRIEGARLYLGVPPAFQRSLKRLHDRVDVDEKARFLCVDLARPAEVRDGRVVNLSYAGCLLEADPPPPAGQLVALAFAGVEAAGKVLRHRDGLAVVAFFARGLERGS